MTNADIARAIDPDNEQGWFKDTCSFCFGVLSVYSVPCKAGERLKDYYTGPDFTLRSEAWRMEMWLEAHSDYYYWIRASGLLTNQHVTTVYDEFDEAVAEHKDHNAALIAAVKEIANADA